MTSSVEGVGSLKSSGAPFNLASSKSSGFVYDKKIVVEDSQGRYFDDFVNPINGLNAGGSNIYTFVFPPVSDFFLMMNEMTLSVKCKIIKKANNAQCTDTDNYSVINNLLQSMWRRCEILLNDVHVLNNSSDYVNYKAYLETILSYEGDAKDSKFQIILS